MLANRMTRLRELLGYDLLVPDNSLDRDRSNLSGCCTSISGSRI